MTSSATEASHSKQKEYNASQRTLSARLDARSQHHAAFGPAAPLSRTIFDPWNSSSTGHQRVENRLSGSTSWRESRNLKLEGQFKSGLSSGKRVADTVGAGSEDFGKDGRKANDGWEGGAKSLRTGGQKSLMEIWGATKSGQRAELEKCLEIGDSQYEKVEPVASLDDGKFLPCDHFSTVFTICPEGRVLPTANEPWHMPAYPFMYAC